jgi:YidC/Oxa1 family membrane protein insertase
MNKNDKIIVGVLFCLLLGWSFYGRKLAPPPPPPPDAEASSVETGENADPSASAVSVTNEVAATTPATAVDSATEAPLADIVHEKPEQVLFLENDQVRLAFSSWGGGVTSAELTEFPATMEKDSGPVLLDFAKRPALTYGELPGLSVANDFEINHLSGVNGVRVSRQDASGLSLSRIAVFTNGYALVVTDTIENESDAPIAIANAWMNIGPMPHVQTKAKTRGVSYLGADTLSTVEGKAAVTFWGKKLSGLFGAKGGCSKPDLRGVPLTRVKDIPDPVDWVAVKNKFFAQVMVPSDGGTACKLFAGREDSETAFTLSEVSAAVTLSDQILQPGESFERTTHYYVGPKKFSELRAQGHGEDRIMLKSWPFFGWWRGACIGLLWLLNFLKAITFNYGVAIILLTIIVKVVFWPVTHKGTESMKRMQKLQPQLAKLREKFKDNPKKLQEKQMLLYRENNVNPVAGCLPMFIQMPVFIALFTVLRSAVELRYSSFLWIADLSEPEGLLAGVLPFPAGGLNLLPIAMTATMVLQQRLTPSTGDPQQQKMMQFMPIMMLFLFYNMSAGLVLYWTVSQVLSILQLVMQQRKDKLAAATA